MKVTEVVIPAAGLGTRFLPFTKSVPKEMLPILDKPAIHYIVQEAVDAGITDVCIVSHRSKHALEHYFAPCKELEDMLDKRGKRDLIASVDELMRKADVSFVYQDAPLGLGHALLQAKDTMKGDHFASMFPDDFVVDNPCAMRQLIEIAEREGADVVIGLARVPDEQLSSYGVVKLGQDFGNGVGVVEALIEKPQPGQAPSNLAILGRYVLPKEVFEIFETLPPSPRGEIELPDAVRILIEQGKKVLGVVLEGRWLGTGNPADWLETNLYFARKEASCRAVIERECT